MKKLLLAISPLLVLTAAQCAEKKSNQPNIVIIYADDMGYGDLNCQNLDSKIPTPNWDKLVSVGMRFTNAHSSSGVCSPSRFGLLTGMYHWRRQHGIVNSFGKPFFKDSDITLPQLLKTKGYTTACIGKWHLGWDWQFKNEPFFLYFPLPSPHAPIIPNDEFDNKSKAGAYGDFVFQTDWVAGQVLQALKEKGLDENTIIIFSADNGTEAYAWERAEKFGHFSMGSDRGLKQDVWEGGHHIPFIFKWPGHTKPVRSLKLPAFSIVPESVTILLPATFRTKKHGPK